MALIAATSTLLVAPPLAEAQRTRAGCTLLVDVLARPGSAAVPRSNMLSISNAPGAYATHLGGGIVRGRCGDATMTGDSAVYLEHVVQAVMIGNVNYRDTTRVLDAQRVTYFGIVDQVIAEGDVRLQRLRSGARLEGPRVQFFRTPGEGRRTVATGRPRMTLPTQSGPAPGEPFVVDADQAEFLGDESAFARGSVLIERSDLTAVADSARFVAAEGLGVLYGRPRVVGEAFRLSGDSVIARFASGELREVHAVGGGRASGARFEIQSEEIRAQMGDGEIDRLWAFGQGRAIAASGRYRLAGDSIAFAFAGGRLDTVVAIGSATSVEADPVEGEAPLEEPVLSLEVGANWISGDTIRAAFVQAGETPSGPAAEADPSMERLLALAQARSFYAGVRDSTTSREPSHNYLVGEAIEIRFRDGEPSEVIGRDAIGVYLEPVREGRRR